MKFKQHLHVLILFQEYCTFSKKTFQSPSCLKRDSKLIALGYLLYANAQQLFAHLVNAADDKICTALEPFVLLRDGPQLRFWFSYLYLLEKNFTCDRCYQHLITIETFSQTDFVMNW